jgi:hypothetical protein
MPVPVVAMVEQESPTLAVCLQLEAVAGATNVLVLLVLVGAVLEVQEPCIMRSRESQGVLTPEMGVGAHTLAQEAMVGRALSSSATDAVVQPSG